MVLYFQPTASNKHHVAMVVWNFPDARKQKFNEALIEKYIIFFSQALSLKIMIFTGD